MISKQRHVDALYQLKEALDRESAVARATTDNLAMMLRRMIWMAEKETGDTSMKVLAGKAKRMLINYGLEGSPLRESP